MTKYVYLFKEGDATMRNILGGKGANLAEMTKIGLPVPQGFTVSTEACTRYYQDGRVIGEDIVEQIYAALAEKAGSAKAVNIVLMGRLAHYLSISREKWEAAIRVSVKPAFVELNLRAFALGYESN